MGRPLAFVLLLLPLVCPYTLVYDKHYSRTLPRLPPGMPAEDEPMEEVMANSTQFPDCPGFMCNCYSPPAECPNEHIHFWFYTRATQNYPKELKMDDPMTLTREYIQAHKANPWKFLIHGYTGYRDYAPNPEIRAAYFEKGDYNIISIDYGKIVQSPCYLQAAYNVPLVANCTAQFLDTLIENRVFKLKQLHVIGFSLGAQVAGYIHDFLRSGQIRRITGLDPAAPLFNLGERLDSSDAAFVDAIHTNAMQKGQFRTCGHIDFYVNGGTDQLGCSPAEYGSVSSCNHARAVRYYAESISTEVGFYGVPCSYHFAYQYGFCPANESTQVIMGEYTPESSRGVYYLETNPNPPFAKGIQVY